MSKVLQVGLGLEPRYVLEFLAERFDALGARERDETIIHELMHIPRNFGGGFRFHDHVTARNVRRLLERYEAAKKA